MSLKEDDDRTAKGTRALALALALVLATVRARVLTGMAESERTVWTKRRA